MDFDGIHIEYSIILFISLNIFPSQVVDGVGADRESSETMQNASLHCFTNTMVVAFLVEASVCCNTLPVHLDCVRPIRLELVLVGDRCSFGLCAAACEVKKANVDAFMVLQGCITIIWEALTVHYSRTHRAAR